jgi:hypothetical protein
MAQKEKLFGWGLTLGAFGLALIGVTGAVLPADQVEAASKGAGAAAKASGAPQSTFSLSCKHEAPRPGFQLISDEPDEPVAPAGEPSCKLRREDW